MTPDEVVKMIEDIRADFPDEMPEQDSKFSLIWRNKKEALSSAISIIQDYQKLRERVSVENIKLKLYEQGVLMNYEDDRKRVSQAIVTYLQQQ